MLTLFITYLDSILQLGIFQRASSYLQFNNLFRFKVV